MHDLSNERQSPDWLRSSSASDCLGSAQDKIDRHLTSVAPHSFVHAIFNCYITARHRTQQLSPCLRNKVREN
jgi:hypothetical protein